MDMITKTYKDQYERNGRLYDSLREMKKEEEKKINKMLYDFVDHEYDKQKNNRNTHMMSYDITFHYMEELRAKMDIISNYEKIRHVFFEIEQEREKLANELRLFAWKESFFPNSFVWTGEVQHEV